MMIQFLVPHVINLSQNGYTIELACSNVGDRLNEVRNVLGPYTNAIHEVRLKRSPFSTKNILGYKDMVNVITKKHYDIIWTNEPVMGVVTRLAARKARKTGTKVMYMIHGFHFYKGAPLSNWLVYYPTESICSRFTDVICTINTEDFKRASNFRTSRVDYIHGIGVNTNRFPGIKKSAYIRKELDLSKSEIILLSIGELNQNKNHRVIIKALGLLNNKNIHYVICGKGAEEENLKKLALEEGINLNVHFLGYRQDIMDICCSADIFVMPSIREGLGLAALEAMYCGLPLITSNARGLVDVNKNGINGYTCESKNYKDFADKIKLLVNDVGLCKKIGERNQKDVLPFTIDNTIEEVLSLLNKTLNRS